MVSEAEEVNVGKKKSNKKSGRPKAKKDGGHAVVAPVAQIIWASADGSGYGVAAGPVDANDLEKGELHIDEREGDLTPGRYLRVDSEVEALVHAGTGEDTPIFMHDSWTAYTESMASLEPIKRKDKVRRIDELRQDLHDLAELRVARDSMSISPIITWSEDGDDGSVLRLAGSVALMRPRGSR